MKTKISVIIPVYNVEKYLDRCVNSIVNQTYRDLEIILVDDGTRDRSGQICDRWTQKDSRIKVIHKSNGGLGSARNVGIKIAEGEYIAFVDSDDYIAPSICQDCIDQLKKHKADICYFGSARVYPDGTVRVNHSFFPDYLNGREELQKEIMPKCYGRYPGDAFGIGTAWGGIYRRELIQRYKIEFPSERELISEDYVFTADICYVADSIAFVNKIGYLYCENETSLSHSYREDRFEKNVCFYLNRVEDIRRKQQNKNCLERAKLRYWDMTFGCLFQEIRNPFLSKQQKMKRIKEICKSPLLDEVNTSVKYLCFDKKILVWLITRKYCKLIFVLANISAIIRKWTR